MIIKPGKVIVSEDRVEIHEFHFDGADGKSSDVEAIEWAIDRLRSVLPQETHTGVGMTMEFEDGKRVA